MCKNLFDIYDLDLIDPGAYLQLGMSSVKYIHLLSVCIRNGENSLKIKREKSTSTRGHYVTNSVLLPAVIEAKEKGKVTDKLISMIKLIAERYSRKSNFIGYSFREDMVASAVVNLCNNALKFNLAKSANPFSFYTTAIHNSFLQFMADEKKHRNIKDALLVDAGANPSFGYMCSRDKSEESQTSDDLDVRDDDPHNHLDDFKPVEKDETKPLRSRHPKWTAREPGPVTVYKPDEYEWDPETRTLTIKKKDAPPPEPVRIYKPRKSLVVKKRVSMFGKPVKAKVKNKEDKKTVKKSKVLPKKKKTPAKHK